MSEIVIHDIIPRYLPQVEEIFFESTTRKEFSSEQERENFKWKYLDFYLENYPELAWIAVREEYVLGYIVGMPVSNDEKLLLIQPHMTFFVSHFEKFPAHLHVNCHHSSRGMGIGKLLTLHLLDQFRSLDVAGVHIMTGTQSENRVFYQKLGFDFEAVENAILFMGKSLS